MPLGRVISWPTRGGGPRRIPGRPSLEGTRKGKQFLQQKQEARPAPGVINSAQPAPPSPSPLTPHEAWFAVYCPDFTGQRASIPEERKLGSTTVCSREEDAPQTTRGVSPGHAQHVVWAPFSGAAAVSRTARDVYTACLQSLGPTLYNLIGNGMLGLRVGDGRVGERTIN